MTYSGLGLVNHKVKVAVRLRPFIERERLEGAKNNWASHPTEIIHVDPDTQLPKAHTQKFVFDNVFGPEVSTRKVYDDIVAPIVNEAFNGFNGTVLCYGQTSSGKTHTLYGTEADPGIIPFLADDIQKRLESVPAGKVVVRLNLIEIYNENAKDLLCSENPIELVERDGTVVPLHAEHIDIFSGNDIIQAAKRLQRERRIGETRMNSQSSRSHTILRMTINTFEEDVLESTVGVEENDNNNESRMSDDDFEGNSSSTPGKRIISAFLNFVDLAGSEKASQTGASGERLREAGHINTSLSALSKVVSQLSKQYETANKKESSSLVSSLVNSIEPRAPPRSRMPANVFVSYRDSKLTRLLQSSLAGDALIAIIANATPASSEETLSTLRFALSAKEIQTKPKRNLITNKLDKLQYESTIRELQAELFGKNEELKILRLALSEKNAKTKGLLKDEVLDRRNTFHFRTRTTTGNWGNLSMIEETEIPRHSASIPLSADEALKEFRELTMLKSPPTSATGDILPPIPVQTTEQEIQTDLIQEDVLINAKKRKLCSEDNSTPKATLRIQKSLLTMTYEEDLKNWQEEKELVSTEIALIKSENAQLVKEMENLKKLNEEKDLAAESHGAELKSLREQNVDRGLQQEFEVGSLNSNITSLQKRLGSIQTAKENLEEQLQEKQTELEVQMTENSNLKIELESCESRLQSLQSEEAESVDVNLKRELMDQVESFKATITDLQDRLASIQETKGNLEFQLQQNQDDLAAHSVENSNLKFENSNLKIDLESYESQLESLRSNQVQIDHSKQELMDEVESLKSNLADIQETLLTVQVSKVNLEEQLQQMHNELESNNAELLTLRAQSLDEENLKQELGADILAMKSNMTSLQNALLSYQEAKETLQEQLQQKQTELEAQTNENSNLQSDLESCILLKQELMDQVESLMSKTDDLQEALLSAEKSKEEFHQQLQLLQADMEAKSAETLNLRQELKAHDAELESLRAQSANMKHAEKLKEELQASCKDNKTLENQISELKTSLEEKELELAGQVCKVQEMNLDMMPRKDFDALNLETDALRAEVEKLRAQEEQLVSTEIALLKSEIAQLLRDVENLTKLNEEKDFAIESHRAELESVRGLLMSQVEDLQGALSSVENSKEELDQQLQLLQTDLEAKLAETAVLRQEQQSRDSELESLRIVSMKDTDKLKEDLRASCRDNETLENQISELKTSLREKEQQLSDQICKLQEINLDGMVSREEFDKLNMEADAMRVEIDKLRVQEKQLVSTEVDLIQSENKQLVRDLENLRKSNEEKEFAAESHEAELKSLRESLNSKLEDLQETLFTVENSKEELNQQLQLLQTDLEAKSTETLSLRQELKAHDAELESLRAQSVNMKYTEKLKEDLRASWRDNKTLENQISELKTALGEKEQELAGQVRKVQELNLDDMVPRNEFDKLNVEANALREEVEKLRLQGTELEKQSLAAAAKCADLKQQLEKAINVRRPPKVNRGQQTPEEWDLSKILQETKVSARIMHRDLEQAKKKVIESQSEKRVELAKFEKQVEEKTARIRTLEQWISITRQEKESSRAKLVDAGIQCQYILELVERSNKGENVELPPEYPNVGNMKSEMNHLRNKVFNLESKLKWCKCEADKKQRLLLSTRAGGSGADFSGTKASPLSTPLNMGTGPTLTSSNLRSRPPVGKPASLPGVFTRASSALTGAGKPGVPPPLPLRPKDIVLGKRGAEQLGTDDPNQPVKRPSRISKTSSNSDETPRISPSPPSTRRTRTTPETATSSSNAETNQMSSTTAPSSTPTRTQPVRNKRVASPISTRSTTSSSSKKTKKTPEKTSSSSTRSNAQTNQMPSTTEPSPPTRTQPVRNARVTSPISTRSTTSSTSKKTSKPSKFIVKDDAEFQAKSDDFMKWLEEQ